MTPFFMRQDIMGECAQLEQFDEELYKVTGAFLAIACKQGHHHRLSRNILRPCRQACGICLVQGVLLAYTGGWLLVYDLSQ
jgi:seryl-tRNA synthetase